MKTSSGRLSATIGKKAKKRLADLQAELRYKGCKDRETSPGKIIAKLLLMEDAFEYLKKEYLRER